MTRPFLLLVPLLLLCTATTGCFISRVATNEPILPQAVSQLKPGQSTASDVVETLGGPNDVVQLGRRSAYRYDASVGKQSALWLLLIAFVNNDQRSDRLWVFFDENDVLTHYGATLSTHRTQYAMPWEDIHEDSDSEEKDAGRPGTVGVSGAGR